MKKQLEIKSVNRCNKCGKSKFIIHTRDKKTDEIKRILCTSCKSTQTLPKFLIKKKETDCYFQAKTVQLYLEGLSQSMIARILGYPESRIKSWINTYCKQLEPIRLSKISGSLLFDETTVYNVKNDFNYSTGVYFFSNESRIILLSREIIKSKKENKIKILKDDSLNIESQHINIPKHYQFPED